MWRLYQFSVVLVYMGTTQSRKSADEGREGGNATERESKITPRERYCERFVARRWRLIHFVLQAEEARSPIQR